MKKLINFAHRDFFYNGKILERQSYQSIWLGFDKRF